MRNKKPKVKKEDYVFSLIAEQVNSGHSIKSFCSQHGISTSTWFYWQKKYQQRNLESPNDKGSFTVLQIAPEMNPVESNLFAEYKGMKIYHPVPAYFLKELIG